MRGMQWKQIRYRLEWAGVKVLASLIPRLPRGGCAALARWVGGRHLRWMSGGGG